MSLSINAQNTYASPYISATRTHAVETTQVEDHVSSPDKAAIFAQTRANSVAPMVSNDVQRALLNLQATGKTNGSSDTTSSNATSGNKTMNTNKGTIDFDLDSYYANDPARSKGMTSLDELPPLLLPSAENIEALSSHASARFQQLLDDYNIPSAPEKITFDNEGKMQIPIDYPYTDELKQAFEENPGLERELRDLNAISSVFVALQERLPMIEEMSNAKSQAQIDQILMKYNHFFDDSDSGKSMALVFSEDGQLGITADGKLLDVAAGEAARGLAVSDKSTTQTAASRAAEATEHQSPSDAVMAFLDYMTKSPAERYYEALLAEEGLTKEELQALPPEERVKIEEKIQRKMTERVEEGASETITAATRTNTALTPEHVADWSAARSAYSIDNRLTEMLVPSSHADENELSV